MAKCSECGARYNKTDVKNEMWETCGFFTEKSYGGLCLDCAINKFIEDRGYDPRDLTEEMDDDEHQSWVEEWIEDRISMEGTGWLF